MYYFLQNMPLHNLPFDFQPYITSSLCLLHNSNGILVFLLFLLVKKKDLYKHHFYFHLIYNQILKMAHGSVLYILETVCFENRDMLLKHFDEDIKEKVYFIPFIEPQLNLYRLIYFDCILD